jgi:NAD(P)-dependent dehydrogenase (short-subunit alcohol dehydrogenase family)
MDDRSAPGVMIVTGGSRGIGASVALLAARHGYSVAVNFAANERAADLVVGDIRKAGAKAIAVQGDVSLERDVMRLFKTADQELGSVSVLVNNAGITGGVSRLAEVSAEMLHRLFAVNVIGSFLCAREAVKRMSERNGGKGGSIVNLSSRAAEIGGAGEWIHYAATKGAIETLTVGLAREVALEGIRVNAVSPGIIETELHAAAGAPDRVKRLGSGVPMGRSGAAQEVAEAVLWLVSPAASYVTGAVLPVAGGR